MYIVGPHELNNEELQELDFISSQMTVNYMRLSVDIYQTVLANRLLLNSKEVTWAQYCSLGAIRSQGYRMGVQAERAKQRNKQSHNRG